MEPDDALESVEITDLPSEVLNCQEVADYLGLHVKTVREYISRGELRAARLGKYYRIKKEWVLEFLDQRSQFH